MFLKAFDITNWNSEKEMVVKLTDSDKEDRLCSTTMISLFVVSIGDVMFTTFDLSNTHACYLEFFLQTDVGDE